MIELLPNRNKDTVVRFLHHLDGKERIQYVVMDMWAPYRDAVRTVIPQAEIVVDNGSDEVGPSVPPDGVGRGSGGHSPWAGCP